MISLTRVRDANVIDAGFHGDGPISRLKASMRRIRDKLANGEQTKIRFTSRSPRYQASADV